MFELELRRLEESQVQKFQLHDFMRVLQNFWTATCQKLWSN